LPQWAFSDKPGFDEKDPIDERGDVWRGQQLRFAKRSCKEWVEVEFHRFFMVKEDLYPRPEEANTYG
jgi:hypothetical protein